MHQRLYYHKTDGGAEYLMDRWVRNPDGSREGVIEGARIIVRIDGDIHKDAEITLSDELFTPGEKSGPYTIIYVADFQAYRIGPFPTEGEALVWARKHNGTDEDTEFDINSQHVYLVLPDHSMYELTAEDLKET